MKLVIVGTILVIVAFLKLASSVGLREEFTWTRISYVWPIYNKTEQEQAIEIALPGDTNTKKENDAPSNITYNYETNTPMGANVWKDKLFITVPRRRPGVPSTLNYVLMNNTNRHNVPLIPYPNWEMNTYDENRLYGGDEEKLTSVYRVAVDSCDRLWFVDFGMIDLQYLPTEVKSTSLVIIDLNTDRIILRHEFEASLLQPTTALVSVTVDVPVKQGKNQCDDAYAYIPDLGSYGLIVYSLKAKTAWRLTHNYFHLEPLSGEFTIGGRSFQWTDGVFSIALGDVQSDGFRYAYFHSLAGTNQYRVSTRVLQNETLAIRSYHGEDFQVVGNRGERSQVSSSDLHVPSGVHFLGLVNQNALGCWNVNRGKPQDYSIVQKDDKKMIYPSDVKINGNNVIALTNNMPISLYGSLNYDETNFRVWVQSVEKAIEGTNCGG